MGVGWVGGGGGVGDAVCCGGFLGWGKVHGEVVQDEGAEAARAAG